MGGGRAGPIAQGARHADSRYEAPRLPEENLTAANVVLRSGDLAELDLLPAGSARYCTVIAELRRMEVTPAARRCGISRRLLGELEETARSLWYTVIRLETGNRQAEAVGLYESVGYARIPPYGPYVGDERSVCFEKPLSRARRRP
jgi:putative acetyltransferase